jgi:chaperonin GroEL (HSP60 family)
MSDVIILDREAKEKILKGIEKLSKSVGVSLGPFEKNAILISRDGFVSQTRDPKLIAKIVSSSDPLEQFGIQMVRDSSAFDAETLILTEAIFRQSLQAVFNGGDSFIIKKELEELSKSLVKVLDEMAVQKETKGGNLRFDKGFISPYFVTNPKEMISELEEPYVYLTNQKLKTVDEVLPILESLPSLKHVSVLILAEDVCSEALDLLVVNHLKGKLKIVVSREQSNLEKIAFLTKAEIVKANFSKQCFGRAKKVVMSERSTRIETSQVLQTSILPGYALSYIRAVEKLKMRKQYSIGLEILEKAVLQPLKVIAENGHMNPQIVLATILEGENDFGLFPEKGIFAPLISLGITDLLEDIKYRVRKAISTACSLLAIDSIIT